MAIYAQNRIQALIEDTNAAFMSCDGSMNTDYAEFASLALSEFKTALRDPALTRNDLMKILRKGMAKHRNRDPDMWSALMAKHIGKAANKTIA